MPSTSDDSYYSWSVLLNKSIFSVDGLDPATPWKSPSILPSASVAASTDNSGVTYYVRFTLPNSQSTVPIDETALYQLDDFSFGDTQNISTGGSSGPGSSKASLNSLNLSFSQPDLDPVLFQYLSSGGRFAEVDVLGYNSDGTLASADSFGLAQASSLGFADGSTTAAFQYGAQSLATYATVGGSTSPISQSSWNQILNQPGFSTDGTSSSSALSPPLSLPSTDVVVSASDDDTYSASFALQGSKSIPGLRTNGAYAISDFSFSEQTPVDLGSGSEGAGAGKTSFQPLSVTFGDRSLLAPVLEMLATGTPIEELDIVGDNSSGQGLTKYAFALAQLTSLCVDNTGQYVMNLVAAAEQIQAFDPNSGTGLPISSGQWSQVTNSSSFSADNVLATPAAAVEARAAAAEADPGTLTYYVRVTLPAGETASSALDGQTLYQLNGFSFQDTQSAVIGSSTGASGAGKAKFGDLSLDITQSNLLPEAFSNSHFGKIS